MPLVTAKIKSNFVWFKLLQPMPFHFKSLFFVAGSLARIHWQRESVKAPILLSMAEAFLPYRWDRGYGWRPICSRGEGSWKKYMEHRQY